MAADSSGTAAIDSCSSQMTSVMAAPTSTGSRGQSDHVDEHAPRQRSLAADAPDRVDLRFHHVDDQDGGDGDEHDRHAGDGRRLLRPGRPRIRSRFAMRSPAACAAAGIALGPGEILEQRVPARRMRRRPSPAERGPARVANDRLPAARVQPTPARCCHTRTTRVTGPTKVTRPPAAGRRHARGRGQREVWEPSRHGDYPRPRGSRKLGQCNRRPMRVAREAPAAPTAIRHRRSRDDRQPRVCRRDTKPPFWAAAASGASTRCFATSPASSASSRATLAAAVPIRPTTPCAAAAPATPRSSAWSSIRR